MSKREEMLKLKQQRMAEMKKNDIDTPAEEAALNAEKHQEGIKSKEKALEPQNDGNNEQIRPVENVPRPAQQENDNNIDTKEVPLEERKTISVRLYKTNYQYINIRSAQLNISQQLFVDNMIDHERNTVKKEEIDPFAIVQPTKEENYPKALYIKLDDYDFLTEYASIHGMKRSKYINYIIEKSRKENF